MHTLAIICAVLGGLTLLAIATLLFVLSKMGQEIDDE